MGKKSGSAVSVRVSSNLFLVRALVPSSQPAVKTETPVNHVAVIDCSGSMSYDLPKLRDQVKSKIPKLLGEKDTLSIIWFSSRGEYGVLLEAEPVATLKDLQAVNNAIDKYLRPVGMTGFKEPLEEVERLAAKLAKKGAPGAALSLFFMSDGCDNQWGRPEILKAMEKAAGVSASVTIVEYGYYADRNLLASMAEKGGGTLIFAQDFDRYAPLFEAAMQKKVVGAPKIELPISGDPVSGFVYGFDGKDLTTFAVEGGKAKVPETLKEVWYLSPSAIGSTDGELEAVSKAASNSGKDDDAMQSAYAAISLFSVRMQPNVVYPLLKAVGDISFIEKFASCFGKQKYSEFMESARVAALDTKARFTKGWDPKKVPRDDAFTVLEMLRILQDDEDNRVLLDHEKFKYSPIGRGRVDASEILTEEEQAEIQALTARMATEKNTKKLKELTEELAKLTAKKGEALKFEADKVPDGYSISSLTFNEDRPNVSFLIKKMGSVNVSSRLPKEFSGKVPEKFGSFIYRNYTVIKDGLINMACLPVKLSAKTWSKIKGLIDSGDIVPEAVTWDNSGVVLLMLDKLPVVNRQMVKAVSAKALFEMQYELEKARAAQKVYKAFRDEKLPKKESPTYKAIYGEDAANWLKEQGFTDYSGFGPKVVLTPSTDQYLGKVLEVKLSGLSKLPSMKELRDQMAKKKINAGGALMVPFVNEVEDYLASKEYKNASDPDKVFEKWISEKAQKAIQATRTLIFGMAQIKFAIVVGQTWPTEFASLDENTLTIKVKPDPKSAEVDLSCKLEMKEEVIKI